MDISIIIPAYNEEKRLEGTLEKIRSFFNGKNMAYEVLVVDDGSRDRTVEVAERTSLAGKFILRVLSNGENRGKGYSVRRGIKNAEGNLVLVTDADLSTPIEEISKLEKYLREGFHIAIGSRSLKGSEVKVSQPIYRVLMGKTFNLLVRGFVMKGIIDTQCGFKLMKRECLEKILPGMKIDGFSFDVELLYLARKKGYKIKEVPVVWRDCRGSKVNPLSDSLRMFKDLFYIKTLHSKR